MDRRALVCILCILMVPFSAIACPDDEKFCPDRNGCVSNSQNCSDGAILSCVNETAPCDRNGTRRCVDVGNYTCGNFSCDNSTKYCATRKSCISLDENCCTEREEACVEVMKFEEFFKPGETFDAICHLLAFSANFSYNYTELRSKNLLEDNRCKNGTYFCPLALDCMPNNASCDPNAVHMMDDSFGVFDLECAKANKTFCPLVLNCIPKEENCSYDSLFDWYDDGNISVDPFGKLCAANKSFCPYSFSCREGCALEDFMGNKSCNGTQGNIVCPFKCDLNDSDCKSRLGPANFTNITDSTRSGWLEACKHGKLITKTFWQKTSECKPLAAKCKRHKKKCRFSPNELCKKLDQYNKTEWVANKLNGSEQENVTVWFGDCSMMVNTSMLDMCKNKSCEIKELCNLIDNLVEESNSSQMNQSVTVGGCNITLNETVYEICNISMPDKNDSCAIRELCHLIDDLVEKSNSSMMNQSVTVGGCNITLNKTVYEICNISMPDKNDSCAIRELCHLIDDLVEKSNSSMMNQSVTVGGCNINLNETVYEICNISMPDKNDSCAIRELCHLIDDLVEKSNSSMMNQSVTVGGCNINLNETVYEICNISMPDKNDSCAIRELCHLIDDLVEKSGSSMMNQSVTVGGCNITLNKTVYEICNISMPDKNDSCAIRELCHLIDDLVEKSNSSMMNQSVTVGGCNINLNETVHEICNISMPDKNDSCAIRELCHLIDDLVEKSGSSMMNQSVTVGGCNITLNKTVYEICNISMPDKNDSCAIRELCHLIDDLVEKSGSSMMNQSVTVGGCNITLNKTVYEICNISMPDKNNSCAIRKLCHLMDDLVEKSNSSMMNQTVTVGGCNITLNKIVYEVCNISVADKNRSCELQKLCPLIDDLVKESNSSLMNQSVTVSGCNITLNKTIYEICNISMADKNRSCEIHNLCDELVKKINARKNDSNLMNKTIQVEHCNVTLNASALQICNIWLPEINTDSCQIHGLCDEISDKLENKTNVPLNRTISIGRCNITLNSNVLQTCNISLLEHDSCTVPKLCHLIKEFVESNGSSVVNSTINVGGCNVTVNVTVLEICNITIPESCEIADLCPKLTLMVSNYTKYSLPTQPVKVSSCSVRLNETVLKEECNITLAELGEYYYKTFYNGFKVSDSISGVGHIAIRALGVGQDVGTWKYKSAGVWTPFGAVTPARALVVTANTHLRFMPNDPQWHGLAILKYSPLNFVPSGSHEDVSHVLQDPRNTLALVQYPPRPVANVSRFIGAVYTVPEDEETVGFQVEDRIEMNLTYHVRFNISESHLTHLHEEVIRDYNKTVECYKNLVPAIAIVKTGPSSQGKWQKNGRDLNSVKRSSPAVIAPHDALRFVSAENTYGNWSMKFVPVVYSNSSVSVAKEFFDAPDPIAQSFMGVLVIKNTSKEVIHFLRSVFKEMASSKTTYSLENFNGVVDGMTGSSKNKTEVKNIAALVFDIDLPPSSHPVDLPRVLYPDGNLAIFNNPTTFTFAVHVTPANDQPKVSKTRIFLPDIAYNLSITPNEGKLVRDLVATPLTSDIEGDAIGIAVVQALNTSIGSWYYQAPGGSWVQVIVDNADYTDSMEGEVEAFVLEPTYKIRFQMHQNDTLWSNVEAAEKVKVIFLAWDGSDKRAVGFHNVTRPSDDTSAYSEKSVMAIVRRIGCDGRAGSEGKNDRCGVCGGNGMSCMGCDGVLFSGAVVDDCGNCTGGTTNVTFNVMKDCANECGKSFLDNCQVCQRKDQVKNFTDCTGVCFGGAKINKCGFCAGGSSGNPVTEGEDACGICRGDNSTCLDCANVPNGDKMLDFCDNCLSPSNPRFNSECVALKLNIPGSGPSTGGIAVEVQGAGLKDYSAVQCNFVNLATEASTAASEALLRNSQGARVIRLISPPQLAAGNYRILCKFDAENQQYLVDDTPFLVYNKALINYASVSPAETSVNSAVVAHITGSGFVNATDLACVSQQRHVFEATFINSSCVSCSIFASKESARLQLALSFSRADRGVEVAKSVNFTVFANASTPLRAMFMDSLQGILVTFDVPSKPRIKSEDCATFFAAENLTLFGSKSKCKFRTPTTMVIELLRRPTIAPRDNILFKRRSIEQKFQKVSRMPAEETASLGVEGPRNAVVPKAVLTGTDLLGLCASLKLDGGQSYGGGGRRLEFLWSVEWEDNTDPKINANATADLAEINRELSGLSSTESRVTFNRSYIVIGPRYKFVLRVRNFLSQTSENTSIIVQRENKQVPGLSLGAKKKRMKTALGTTLEGKVKLSPCLPKGYKPKVLFSWEIKAVGVDLGVINQPRLRIAPRVLQGGKTYKLTLTASMEEDASLSTTVEISLEVESSPLNAVIKGGDVLVVGEDDAFVLDASPSADPDGSSDIASYEWLCFEAGGGPCFEPDPKNPGRQKRMVIPSLRKASIAVAKTLKTNSEYKFKLIFRKGFRSREATVTVFVKAGAPPRVVIRPLASSKVNPTDTLIIGSLVKSKKSVNVSWSCVQEPGNGFIAFDEAGVLLTPHTKTFVKRTGKAEVVASLDLVIDKDKLENGVQYKFRLLAEHPDSSAYSDLTITTNAAPSQGTLEISPADGFFGNTTFTFSAAEGWSDSADDLPLTYQFGYQYRDPVSGELREELLGTPVESNVLEVDLLPQGEKANNFSLSVFVEVADIYGAKTRQQASVVVRPIVIDASAVSEFANDVDNDFESGDLAKGTSKANAVVGALSGSGPADANTTRALNDFKNDVTDKVLTATESGGVQDKSGKGVVKGSLLQMTSGCKPNCDPARVAKNLAKMEGSDQSSKSRRRRRAVQATDIEVKTGDEVETVLEIFDNVISAEDYSNSSMKAKEDLLSTIRAQEKSLCKGLATGGPKELAKSNITVIRAVKDIFASVDSDFMMVSCSDSPKYITATVLYRLGETLKTQYESWACTADDTCTGTCIATAQFKDDLLIPHDPSDKNLTRLSDVASLRLYNPQTHAEISVSGLASPVAIRFPIENDKLYENHTKECRVWDDGLKEWSMSGCTDYSTINDSMIECSCTQLGYVAVFKGKIAKPTTLPPVSTTVGPTKPSEEAVRVEFAFAADYNTTISGNITKAVFISHLKTLLSSLLNISESRIFDMDIRHGSIIVSFSILPSNNTNQFSVNSTVQSLQQLVENNKINLILPGLSQPVRVDPSSFKIILSGPTVASTTTTAKPEESDDDGLSTAQIVIIAVVCSLAFLALIAAVLYYFLHVKPNRSGRISPKSSQMQLNDRENSHPLNSNQGVNNNAVDVDEKAV